MDNLVVVENNQLMITDEVMANIQAIWESAKFYGDLQKKVTAQLKDYCLANNTALDLDGLSAKFSQVSDKEDFDLKQFKADHPDLYKQYVSMKPQTPRFLVKVK